MKEIAERWRRDPVSFIEQVLVNPETAKPFTLYPAQRAFLRTAFTLRPDGRLKYTELAYCATKKSGKTSMAAMITAYTAIVLTPLNGELYLLANDREQAQSRVFKVLVQIPEASPLLRGAVTITANRITVTTSGTTVIALPNDYRGFSESNPTLNVYDETAYFTAEASHRLWDEGMPSPARQLSFRLSVSTAGFEGEPSPLKDLYERTVIGGTLIAPDLYERDNTLVFWSHNPRLAPWVSSEWVEEQRAALRPTQFARLIENRWVASESIFIALSEFDACTAADATPVFSSSSLDVYVAVDASLKHDSTAIAAVA
jgi:phage terminase large subunit-like protein